MMISAIAFRSAKGISRTPEYRRWEAMKQRCYNSKCKAYPYYGGRGIKVCDSWLKFSGFFADMGFRPSPDHSLDRIDSNGDYGPDNCRWTTDDIQIANRSCTVWVEHEGE